MSRLGRPANESNKCYMHAALLALFGGPNPELQGLVLRDGDATNNTPKTAFKAALKRYAEALWAGQVPKASWVSDVVKAHPSLGVGLPGGPDGVAGGATSSASEFLGRVLDTVAPKRVLTTSAPLTKTVTKTWGSVHAMHLRDCVGVGALNLADITPAVLATQPVSESAPNPTKSFMVTLATPHLNFQTLDLPGNDGVEAYVDGKPKTVKGKPLAEVVGATRIVDVDLAEALAVAKAYCPSLHSGRYTPLEVKRVAHVVSNLKNKLPVQVCEWCLRQCGLSRDLTRVLAARRLRRSAAQQIAALAIEGLILVGADTKAWTVLQMLDGRAPAALWVGKQSTYLRDYASLTQTCCLPSMFPDTPPYITGTSTTVARGESTGGFVLNVPSAGFELKPSFELQDRTFWLTAVVEFRVAHFTTLLCQKPGASWLAYDTMNARNGYVSVKWSDVQTRAKATGVLFTYSATKPTLTPTSIPAPTPKTTTTSKPQDAKHAKKPKLATPVFTTGERRVHLKHLMRLARARHWDLVQDYLLAHRAAFFPRSAGGLTPADAPLITKAFRIAALLWGFRYDATSQTLVLVSPRRLNTYLRDPKRLIHPPLRAKGATLVSSVLKSLQRLSIKARHSALGRAMEMCVG